MTLNMGSIDNIIAELTSVMNNVSSETVSRSTFKPFVKSYWTGELKTFF